MLVFYLLFFFRNVLLESWGIRPWIVLQTMKQFLFGSFSHMNSVGSTVGLGSMLTYHVEQRDFWETFLFWWFQG